MKHKLLVLLTALILFTPTFASARMLDEDTHPEIKGGGGGGTTGGFRECSKGQVKYDKVQIHSGHFARWKSVCDTSFNLYIWSSGWDYLSAAETFSYLESVGQNHTKNVARGDNATSYEVWKINDTKQWVRVIGGNWMTKGRYSGLRQVKTIGHQHSSSNTPYAAIGRVSVSRNNAKFHFSASR
jgi:hypothetical protein